MTLQPYDPGEGSSRGYVIYRVLGRDRNRKLLQHLPFIPYLDLAIVFYLYFRIPEYGSFVTQITSEQMRGQGETTKDLFRQARFHTPRVLPVRFCSLHEIVQETFPSLLTREGQDLFVLTNEDQRYGAAALLYEGQLAAVGCSLRENFYVLPSSVHETIVVPASRAPDPEDLKDIVREINGSFVDPEEVLSDSVYYYDCLIGALRQV